MTAISFMLIAGYATLAVTAAELYRHIAPTFVLRIAPVDARARLALAEQEIAYSEGPDASSRAADLVREALLRDPTLAGGWRTLGMIEGGKGNHPAASRLFETAQRISRRDPPTQLWLIEEHVRRDDVRGALRQYDIALRTSTSMLDVLMPTLVAAAADPAIAAPLAKILANEPPWAFHFYNYLVGGLPSGKTILGVIDRLPADVRLRHLETLRKSISLAAERQEYEAAWGIYLRLSGTSQDEALRNGGFERVSEFPVFEWQFTDTSELRAEQAAAPGAPEEVALHIIATRGARGGVATQLLMLKPGSYRFSTATEVVTPPAPERLQWRISCEGAAGALLNQDATPSRPGRALEFHNTFRVPQSACRAQRILLEAAAPDSALATEAWIHRVAIQAIDGRAD